MIEIYVTGCVRSPGRHKVKRFASLRRAIAVAGGVVRNGLLAPSGMVTVRTFNRISRRNEVAFRADALRERHLLDRTRLLHNDRVIVAYGSGLSTWSGRSKSRFSNLTNSRSGP